MRGEVRHLGKGIAIYGAGDAAVQVVSLLLLPVYVKYGFLVSHDYGAISLIVAIEMLAKTVSRWGLDGAFMRFYHDRAPGGPLERLTSTIVWFTLAADAVVFALLFAASGAIADRLFPEHLTAFRLMIANTWLISLTFVPFHLLRLRNEAARYSLLVFIRAAGVMVLRIVFVIALGWGTAGWFAADLALTLILLPVLWRTMRPIVAMTFSREDLGRVLRFGLPRLPHGLAQQALDAGNKLLLTRFIPLGQQGVYQNGFTLGTGVRFFTSAFETAWAPFYYATAKAPDAAVVFGKLTTYVGAALVLLVAGTIAVSRDVVHVMLTPEYLEAVPVIPLIAVGMALQGAYLLTSIGLNLTSRTQYYPVATFAALAVGLGGGLALMPSWGIRGAAAAFAASAATQSVVAFAFARQFYRIPYELGRLARVLVAGAAAVVAGLWLVPPVAPMAGLVLRGLVVIAVFALVLLATGFFRRSERAFLAEQIDRWRRRPVSATQSGAGDV